MRWLRCALLLLMLGIFIMPAAAQEAEPSDPTVQWSFEPIYGETSKQGAWVPIKVRIKNTGTDRVFRIVANNRYEMVIDVPGGGEKEVITYFFQNMTSRLQIELLVGETSLGTDRLIIRNTNHSLIATVGTIPPPNLPDKTFIQLDPSAIPATWMGLDLLDGMLLNFDAWNSLNSEQHQALKTWVGQGGTLIATPDLLASLPTELVPAQLGAPRTFALPEIFVNAVGLVDTSPVDGIQLFPDSQTQTWLSVPSGPVLVARPYGAGHVVASALNVFDPEILRWGLSEPLWESLMPENLALPAWQRTNDPQVMRDSQVTIFLTNLPALDMPPLQILLTILGIYVLLVGPVNYFVLRRLDRVALAWVTIPVLTLIFAGITFGLGAQQRGSDIIVNELVVYDQTISNQPAAVAQGYVGVFSPHQSTYTIAGNPDLVFRELVGGFSTASSDHHFVQNPSQVKDLEINQWSLETFGYVQQTTTPPAVEIDMFVEQDTLRGTVRNIGSVTLNDPVVVIGASFQKLESLAPGAEQQIELKIQDTTMQTTLSYIVYQKELDAGYQRPEGPPRDLLTRTQALDIAAAGLEYQSQQPVFVAFPELESMDTLTLPDERYAHQRVAVLITKPQLRFAPNSEVAIASSMVSVRSLGQNMNGEDWCMTQRGQGIGMMSNGSTMEIGLPAAASQLQFNQLTFAPSIDGMFGINELVFSVYNWNTSAWEEQTLEQRRFTLAGDAYIRNGKIRLQVLPKDNPGGRGDEWWGCFAPGVSVTGSTP